MHKKIRDFRKELHRHPELSGRETATVQRVRKFIEKNNPTEMVSGLGGNGLAVIYDFAEGPVVMIRCELDALPIEEENDFEHRSQNNGISHKCGHDGHMAIVAGLSNYLKNKTYRGKVILLFQPAEETGKGAYAMLNDPRFEQLEPDYIFALHNIPGEPMNSVIMVDNFFSATVQSFRIELRGKQAHASEPEQGINPAYAVSELISRLNSLQERSPEKDNFALLTPIHINLGTKDYGISAGRGDLHYTIRTWAKEEMEKLKENIIENIETVCEKEKLNFSIDWFDFFPASINNEECNSYIKTAASQLELRTITRPYPLKFGEDFGWFSQRFKGAMFGIGAGENTPALHHTNYDFPDELLLSGISMFLAILDQILGEQLY